MNESSPVKNTHIVQQRTHRILAWVQSLPDESGQGKLRNSFQGLLNPLRILFSREGAVSLHLRSPRSEIAEESARGLQTSVSPRKLIGEFAFRPSWLTRMHTGPALGAPALGRQALGTRKTPNIEHWLYIGGGVFVTFTSTGAKSVAFPLLCSSSRPRTGPPSTS